jgi:hypothetical protein
MAQGAVPWIKFPTSPMILPSRTGGFLGWIDESRVGVLCADAGVLVLSSRVDGLAIAALPGLSHGIVDGRDSVGAHSACAVDDECRQRLGAAARRRFWEMFDVRTCGEQPASYEPRIGWSGRRHHSR